MVPFHCPLCSRKSFSAGIPRCLHCDTIERGSIAIGENSHSPIPEAPRNSSEAFESRYHIVTNNTEMVKLVPVHDREIYVSKDRIITDNTQAHERSSNVMSRKSGSVFPTCSEQGGMNYALASDTMETNRMASGSSSLDSTCNNLSNSNEPFQKNRGMEELGYSRTTTHQHIPWNIGISQSSENENSPREISVSRASKEKGLSVDDILAVPGPSGFHQNEKKSNVCWEKFLSGTVAEFQPTVFEGEVPANCNLCKRDISEHRVEQEGKIFYDCCACLYRSDKKSDLMVHAELICGCIIRCIICGELIFESNLHDSEWECRFCSRKFQCLALLEDHSLAHEDHCLSHCRICKYKISEHTIQVENRMLYKCCECNYNSQKSNLMPHLYTHTGLKIFKCHVCEIRFAQKYGLERHLHTHKKCEICGLMFLNSQSLEAHHSEMHQT